MEQIDDKVSVTFEFGLTISRILVFDMHFKIFHVT